MRGALDVLEDRLQLTRACRKLVMALSEKVRQLGDVESNSAGFVPCQQSRCGASAGFILEIDMGKSLAVVVLHDEAGFGFVGGPWYGKRRRKSVITPTYGRLDFMRLPVAECCECRVARSQD